MVSSEWARDNSNELKYSKFHLNIIVIFFYHKLDWTQTACPEQLWSFHPLKYLKLDKAQSNLL